jgi:putative tricarboxylic transport membrane protein|tara:strand:+ start:850 stop:1317 length:468 start_codon:yes stop_codon:yes gene_type:complete
VIRPDRIVALLLIAFSIGYGLLAWNYELLPFEEQMPFKPNTMPVGLAIAGIILAVAVLIFPGGHSGLSSDADGWRRFDWISTGAIFLLMVLYALTLRPLGYVLSTTLFLVLGAIVLGERRFKVLIPVAAITAYGTWYLVQQVLGVFLRPWPELLI